MEGAQVRVLEKLYDVAFSGLLQQQKERRWRRASLILVDDTSERACDKSTRMANHKSITVNRTAETHVRRQDSGLKTNKTLSNGLQLGFVPKVSARCCTTKFNRITYGTTTKAIIDFDANQKQVIQKGFWRSQEQGTQKAKAHDSKELNKQNVLQTLCLPFRCCWMLMQKR